MGWLARLEELRNVLCFLVGQLGDANERVGTRLVDKSEQLVLGLHAGGFRTEPEGGFEFLGQLIGTHGLRRRSQWFGRGWRG